MVDPEAIIARLAARQHRVVARAQLLDRKVSSDQIDRAIKRKVLAKQHDKQAKKDAKDKEAKQPEAAPATPEPIKTEQVLTETWSYQLPADE